jgi:hypothetical protein
MTTTVTCAACGKAFEGRNSRARYCKQACQKRGQRNATIAARAASEPGAEPGVEPTAVNLFERATEAELIRLKKLDTMLGQQALVIARRMGQADETGAAIATLSREHSRLMAAAAAGARTADPVDRARETREQKQAQARQAAGRRRRPGR